MATIKTRARKSSRGGALLAVLWLSAALAAIAFSLAHTVRAEAERTSTAVDGVRSYYLAIGALDRAILQMLWTGAVPTNSQFSFPTGEAVVDVIPETAKMNINIAPPEDLFRLLVNLGVEPERAREITLAIVDWRRPLPEGASSAFDSFYLSLSPTFRARHASFEEIEELLLVKGVTPDLFYGTYERDPRTRALAARDGLQDCVSVFGSTDRFDVNTARPEVLAALGLPVDLVHVLVERRRTAPFDARQLAEFGVGAPPAFQRLRVGGNSIFTMRASARLRLPNGQLSDLRRTVGALVKWMPPGYDSPYHILRWYDAPGSH